MGLWLSGLEFVILVLKRYQIQIFLYIVFISILSFVYHQRSFRSRTKKRTKLHHFRKEIQKAIHFGRSSREFWRFRCTWVRIVLFIIIIKVCRKVPSMDAISLIYFFSLLLFALDLQSPAKFPILQAQFELVLFPNIKNRGTIQTSIDFSMRPQLPGGQFSIPPITEAQLAYNDSLLVEAWLYIEPTLHLFIDVVKSRPASDPVDSDLHQQSPAGETDGLVHRGFCFHTMNIDRFHLPCLLIDMHKMCCVFGFWFTGNLKMSGEAYHEGVTCRWRTTLHHLPGLDFPR